MRCRHLLCAGLGVLLLWGGGGVWTVGLAHAQGTDRAAGTVLAQFEEARALAVDPRGRLYVADAGRDVVGIFEADGTRRDVLGGTGTRPGTFDTPSAIDPTNGQTLLVADTYNGRVQRLSTEGQYLESLPVGQAGRRTAGEWTVRDGQGGAPVQGDGRPIGVARDDEGAVFVLDSRNRQVWKWSDVGQVQAVVSGRGGRLQDPVALALGPDRRLYVADAGREAVLIYDAVGTFRRRVPGLAPAAVQALAVHRGRLWIVCPRRVLVWNRAVGVVAEHTVDLGEPLVDVAVYQDRAYLLTETRLLRRPAW
ncbi:NHL repeat-containing protein [Salinibacter sp.]|uniref:NHL repeat-containing protein n=1 Tax=Salinibacter sp. TaxID=2065818 RepID=UPI0021E6FA4F|nr:NHL repeat-containing protein [Salinibacter sp.]